MFGTGTGSEWPRGAAATAASGGERRGGCGGREVSAEGAASPKEDGEGGERMRMKRSCCAFAASVLGPALPHFANAAQVPWVLESVSERFFFCARHLGNSRAEMSKEQASSFRG